MEWINVEKQVPEPHTTVLGICFGEKGYIGVMPVTFSVYSGWETEFENLNLKMRPTVNYWMPLPKYPKDTEIYLPL